MISSHAEANRWCLSSTMMQYSASWAGGAVEASGVDMVGFAETKRAAGLLDPVHRLGRIAENDSPRVRQDDQCNSATRSAVPWVNRSMAVPPNLTVLGR